MRSGYRRPKNLREILVKAELPPKEGDELWDPDHKEVIRNLDPGVDVQTPSTSRQEDKEAETQIAGAQKLKQRSILDFVTREERQGDTDIGTASQALEPILNPKNTETKTSLGSSKKERGFNFCNRRNCKYCPLLNRTGNIECSVTKNKYTSMKNISCRSSNLIYAITCKRCQKQYVGQTLLRVKDRFVKHMYDIENGDKQKAVGLHFSRLDHNGTKDLEITVLEFIKKPPRSPEAVKIRDRVEKRWIHLLRTPAPGGLNIFD